MYLTCDANMTKEATVNVTLGGSAVKAYTAATTMKVVPVKAAVALTGDAAKVGPSALKAGGNAGTNTMTVKCPVAGTAWV